MKNEIERLKNEFENIKKKVGSKVSVKTFQELVILSKNYLI